jgi:hypothetical protein
MIREKTLYNSELNRIYSFNWFSFLNFDRRSDEKGKQRLINVKITPANFLLSQKTIGDKQIQISSRSQFGNL